MERVCTKNKIFGMNRVVWVLLLAVVAVGCGEEVQSTGRRGTGGTKAKARKSKKGRTRRRKRRRTHRRKGVRGKPPELTEQDFMENPEANRDPFRSYLQPEEAEVAAESFEDTRVVLLERYELTELELTGIVGRTNRLAMFRSPDDRTTNIQKGIRISKSKALVVEVAEDHVILQIPQIAEGKRPTFVERILWVDPSRRAVEISGRPLRPDEEGIRYSGWRRGRYLRQRRRNKGAAP
jgi:Tfp pilus assembly protein PilP